MHKLKTLTRELRRWRRQESAFFDEAGMLYSNPRKRIPRGLVATNRTHVLRTYSNGTGAIYF